MPNAFTKVRNLMKIFILILKAFNAFCLVVFG